MTVDGLADVKVGDSLILVTGSRYRGDESVTVARIGRDYLYIAGSFGRERRERFDKKTGIEKADAGTRQRLYTAEQYDELKQRASLFENLRLAGIDVRHEVRASMGTDQLRAILAIVDEKEA